MLETNLDLYIITISIKRLAVKNKDCQNELRKRKNVLNSTKIIEKLA